MNLAELIGQARLPSSVDIITKLQQNIAAGIKSAADLADKIAMDQALTARVLRLANSAYYGRRAVESVEEAVVLIGENDLIALVISAEIIAAFKQVPDVDLDAFWRQNIFAAISAKIIARRLHFDKARLFTSGLLRQIGLLVLYRAVPEQMHALLTTTDTDPTPLHILEQQTLGYDHATVGAELLTRWKIPASITEPIRYYLAPNDIEQSLVGDTAILHLAHKHAQQHFELAVPDWVTDDWLYQILQVPCDALLAEADAEIQLHYERTVTALMS